MGILIISTHVVVLDATVLGIVRTLHTKGVGGMGTMSQCHLQGMMREEHVELMTMYSSVDKCGLLERRDDLTGRWRRLVHHKNSKKNFCEVYRVQNNYFLFSVWKRNTSL